MNKDLTPNTLSPLRTGDGFFIQSSTNIPAFNLQPNSERKQNSFFTNLGLFFGIKQNTGDPTYVSNDNYQQATPTDKAMWVPDERALTCYNCTQEFKSLFLRKHHCRICGNVFCKECTKKTVDGYYWGSSKQLRVCDHCYEMFQKLDETMVDTSNCILNTANPDNILTDEDVYENVCNINNFKRETKLELYCKKTCVEDDENFKFLMLNKSQEDMNFKNYNAYSEFLIKKMIENILLRENLYHNWFKLIYDLTLKTINNVNPTFLDLKDGLNINKYVKIKTIKYKDQSLTRFISGYAMQKNVCSKKMKTDISNPRILLLDCGLEYVRSNKGIVNFDSKINFQESAYFDILMKKINLIKPNVILINKSISMKIQEALSENTSIVMSVKSHTLKRIARCTKSYVLPSTDLIDSQTILGRCKQFKIEKIKQPTIQSEKERNYMNEYNLMIFEGCNSLLGCTIIFSGPDINELKQLKQLMRVILTTARDIFLQKQILFFMFYKMPEFILDGELTRNINENLNKYNNYHSMSQAQIQTLKSKNYHDDFILGFDTTVFFENNLSFKLTKLTIAIGNTQNVEKFWGYNIDRNFDKSSFLTQETNEYEILKTINYICGEHQQLDLEFFSENEFSCDKPFGKLIIDLSQEKESKCEDCKKPKSNHIYYLYQNHGRVKVQMVQPGEEFSDRICGFIDAHKEDFKEFKGSANDIYNYNIFSYGICKICKVIVTPLTKLSREIFNYSLTRMLKIQLYNHKVRNRTNIDFNILSLGPNYVINTCNHLIYKDISRIYLSRLGIVKFSYEDSPIYFIGNYSLKDKDSNNKELCDLIESQFMMIHKKGKNAVDTIKAYLESLEFEIKDITPSFYGDEFKIKFYNKILGITKSQIEKISELENFLQIFSPGKQENFFFANSLKKQYFSKIYQIKIIYCKIKKLLKKFKKMNILNNRSNQENENFQAKISSSEREMIPLERTQSMIDLVKEINFFDENHLKFSNDLNIDDIASIISYTLLSDRYKEKINTNNKFNLLGLKSEIKSKEGYLRNQSSIRQGSFRDSELMNNNLIKNNLSQNLNNRQMSFNSVENDNTKNPQNDEEITETFLLYEPKKNNYFNYQGFDDHKINQLLETELLSDDKENFNWTLSNSNKFLENFDLIFDPQKKVSKPLESLKNDDKKISFEGSEEKSINEKSTEIKTSFNSNLQENIKLIMDELETLKKDLVGITHPNNANIKKNKKIDDSTDIEVTVFFPRQFEALRATYCANYDEFVTSLIKGKNWNDVTGGKSKADFFKSMDNRYVIKSVNKLEFQMFIDAGFQYFHHMAKFLFHKMPSALAKTLGIYKIKVKNAKLNKTENKFIFVMENLFYGLDKTKTHKSYDLKGSKSRRYIPKRDQKPGQVLPDTNFKEDFKGEPLPLDKNMFDLMQSAVHNDSLILCKMNVVDYSMLLIFENVDENESKANFHRPIRIGIIDYVRKYTWDKQLEHVGKIIINRLQVPTIVNPVNYKDRFKEAISNYFIGLD